MDENLFSNHVEGFRTADMTGRGTDGRVKSDMFELMKAQELYWKDAKDVVESLERRLTLVENEKLKLQERIELVAPSNCQGALQTLHRESSSLEDLAGHFNSVYVSPIFEEKRASRARALQHDSAASLEIKELKAEIRNLQSQLSDENRSIRRKGLTPNEKENTNTDMVPVLGIHDERHLNHIHPVNECAPHGFMKVMKEKLAVAKRENGGPLFLAVQAQDKSDEEHSAKWVEGEPSECGKLEGSSNLKALEKIVSQMRIPIRGAADGTWQHLLTDAIEEFCSLKTCLESTRREYENEIQTNKVLLQRLKNEEAHKATILEQHVMELERKEKTLSFAQQLNTELANDMAKTETTLAELRSHFKGLVASMETQLTESKRDLGNVQLKSDQLAKQLASSEARIFSLEHALEDKDKHMEELKRRMLAIQNETDATVMEKFDLVTKSQELKKDYDDKKQKMADLISINEKLLKLVQAKEDQLASLNEETGRQSLQSARTKTDEVSRLKKELDVAQKELKCLREEDQALTQRYKFMKAKLYEMEFELQQREDALERLTKHLAAVLGGEGGVYEEQWKLYLARAANDREQTSEEQLKHSRVIIDELEEKMVYMEAEVSQAKREMGLMKAAAVAAGARQGTIKKSLKRQDAVKESFKWRSHDDEDYDDEDNPVDSRDKERAFINLRNSFPMELHPIY